MKKTYKRLTLLAIITLLICLYFVFDLGQYLTFEQLKLHREALLNYVNEHYLVAVFIFMCIYTVAIGLALPGGALLSIAGGFLFGTIIGALYINIAATIGATISFLLTRYIIGEAMQTRYKDKLEGFNRNMDTYGAYYLLMMRLIMIVPFFLINIVSGLTNISLFTFIWTTSLGIIPGSLVFTYAGQSLTRINSVGDIFSWPVLIAGALLGLLALVPILVKVVRKKPVT